MKNFQCNMELALDVLSGKWKLIIIHHIGNEPNIRYGELLRLIPTIDKRVLSRELNELEEKNLITRKVYNEKVLRVEYALSSIAYELLPVLSELTKWGKKYNEEFSYAQVITDNSDYLSTDNFLPIDKKISN